MINCNKKDSLLLTVREIHITCVCGHQFQDEIGINLNKIGRYVHGTNCPKCGVHLECRLTGEIEAR